MYEVRVQQKFAAAHFLANYHGKCENLHGHNYTVWVNVRGDRLDDGGMLLDFSLLKKSLKDVLAELDHTLLNDHSYFSQGNPSAERIAYYVYQCLHAKMPEVCLSEVSVAETENNVAAYIPDNIDCGPQSL